MQFNKEVCADTEIKEKCCKSCASSDCLDAAVCEFLTPLKTLCQESKHIRDQCPKTCGLCVEKQGFFKYNKRFLNDNA